MALSFRIGTSITTEGTFTVSAHIYWATPSQVAHCAEVIARTAAGLALEGINVSIEVKPTEEE